MNVIGFSSPEEMRDYLRQAAERAHMGLHIAQDRLTYDDCWVQFYDLANRLVIFGHISTLDQVRAGEVAAGATTEEVDWVVESVEKDLGFGYMYGMAYSTFEPKGEVGTTHKAHAWPIERSLFDAAEQVGWNIDRLPQWAKINLEVAYREMRGHVRRNL